MLENIWVGARETVYFLAGGGVGRLILACLRIQTALLLLLFFFWSIGQAVLLQHQVSVYGRKFPVPVASTGDPGLPQEEDVQTPFQAG